MNKGVIYVLTNPSFPEYIKIGYADNLESRLSNLNQSECLPFAFRAYCVYEVNERLTDKNVHELIDKLNPDLRAVETFNGKPRVREFYNMSADDAYQLFKNIATISGTTDRLKLLAPEGHEIIDSEIAEEISDSMTYTEEDHFAKASATVIELYQKIKNKLLADIDKLTIEPKKMYIAFKYKTNVCDMVLQKSKIRIFINLKKEDNIPLDESQPIYETTKGHWGNGYYYYDIGMGTDVSNLDYFYDLIKLALQKQNYPIDCE